MDATNSSKICVTAKKSKFFIPNLVSKLAVNKSNSDISQDNKPSMNKGEDVPAPTQQNIKSDIPCLPYEVILHILHWIQDDLTIPQLKLMRTFGKGWRAAVDNYHLPYCYRPASFWSPFMSDQVPSDDLARSPGRHLRFPEDIQSFNDMCLNQAHNPFPSRELKIWCRSVGLPPLQQLRPSMNSIGNFIWSLTFVVGPSLDSIRLLYDILGKLSFLEDLRVIDTYSTALRRDFLKAKKAGDSVEYPLLRLPSTCQPRLTSLSVTGCRDPSRADPCCRDPSLLDDLLKVFGKGDTLKSLEMQGAQVKRSLVMKQDMLDQSYLTRVKKLKIHGGDYFVFKKLSWYNWSLTHLSFHVVRGFSMPVLSGQFLELLYSYSLVYTLTELYLYFDNLKRIRKQPRKIYLHGAFNNVRVLGLPYKFVEWNCWDLSNCPQVEELKFNNWCHSIRSWKDNSQNIMDKEKKSIKFHVKRYWGYSFLKRISVFFGKSNNNEVVLEREESDDWFDISSSTRFVLF